MKEIKQQQTCEILILGFLIMMAAAIVLTSNQSEEMRVEIEFAKMTDRWNITTMIPWENGDSMRYFETWLSVRPFLVTCVNG